MMELCTGTGSGQWGLINLFGSLNLLLIFIEKLLGKAGVCVRIRVAEAEGLWRTREGVASQSPGRASLKRRHSEKVKLSWPKQGPSAHGPPPLLGSLASAQGP